ncbi:chorismate mutase [Halomicronema sp. CCY15110]|uniref:chorismate mutase n=1 Tax=Halomicronema sp. CCY15110 TaxID=2767773 RepID=UPI001EF36221|nr:chorismate mutase [Halomicronema sp. CCY15110]
MLEEINVGWRIQGIRGAITVSQNSAEAIADATHELLDAIESQNRLSPEYLISVTFSVTQDLDALFPAAAARQRPGWDAVPLLDVQHMHVAGSLPRCIRVLMHAQVPVLHEPVGHVYLREARNLRPDLDDRPVSVPSRRE